MTTAHSTRTSESRNTNSSKAQRSVPFDELYAQIEETAWAAGLDQGNFELIPLGSGPGREVQISIGLDSFAQPRTIEATRALLFQRFKAISEALAEVAQLLAEQGGDHEHEYNAHGFMVMAGSESL